jgi:hypothetical protein
MNRPNDQSIEALTDLTIRLNGRYRSVRLRMPLTKMVYPLIIPEELRTPQRLGMILPIEIFDCIETIDGEPVTLARADAVASDPDLAIALTNRLRLLIEMVSARGIAYASCPSCNKGEADLTQGALMALLQARPWPIFEGPFFALPALSTYLQRGVRPSGIPLMSRLRFKCPTEVLERGTEAQSGFLGSLDTEPVGPREAAAWEKWTVSEETIEGREDWNTGVPGFRALLRLCVALDHGRGVDPGSTSPASIETMPAADFYFLDQLYYLTHNVSIAPDTITITCSVCNTKFLPVF